MSGATLRAPALLVKAVTTLDVLSGGRAWLGIGAGYGEEEARAMGVYLPLVRERFEVLADTLQIAERMWQATSGRFTAATNISNAPSAARCRCPGRGLVC